VQSNYYVTLSAQVALENRLTSVANNLANANTVGFRSENISFESLISRKGDTPVAYVTTGTSHLSRQSGSLNNTGNPLDVAVLGDAWIGIKTPTGTAYTRDGRMRMLPDGSLQTINGDTVLDAGNSGILLDANGGDVTISQDGMISQQGHQIGAIGLFTLPAGAKLTRRSNSSVISDKPAVPVLDFNSNGVQQGFVESSNVSPILDAARMMMISRDFEAVTNAMTMTESSQKDAIKTLGSSS